MSKERTALRLARNTAMVLIFHFPILARAADIACPPMPVAVTDRNRDIRSEIAASVVALGRLKGGEVGAKTEVTAVNLFSKYPNVDKLLALQTMSSTYCGLLRSSSISDSEKLDRWEKFTNRILDLQESNLSMRPGPPTRSPPNYDEKLEPKAEKTPSKKDRDNRHEKDLTVVCSSTWANLCRFRNNRIEATTAEINRGRRIRDIPQEQIWDDATYTPMDKVFVVRKCGLAAIYSWPQQKFLFGYIYNDIRLQVRNDINGKSLEDLSSYFLIVNYGKQQGVVDSNGNLIVPIVFENVFLTEDPNDRKRTYWAIHANRKFGLLDATGEVILHPIYDEPVQPASDERHVFYASVVKSGLKMRVDSKGNLVN
jgi:hypothetical protein